MERLANGEPTLTRNETRGVGEFIIFLVIFQWVDG
uniref:Uncharacterized protein n=1 Tax=Rhizophora mucronata TaxID=61149 RepID=A0A2P2P0C5_RHIMU